MDVLLYNIKVDLTSLQKRRHLLQSIKRCLRGGQQGQELSDVPIRNN